MTAQIKVSVIIPAFNEQGTILRILKEVREQKVDSVDFEIIVVDDCSTDLTLSLLEDNPELYNNLIKLEKNSGKGAAVKAGLEQASGDFILFQDADLEYDPEDYEKLLNPIRLGISNVVYGSRVLNFKNRYYATNSFTSILRILGNHVLTIFSNVINKQNLTDAHTCYKVFKTIELIEGGAQEKEVS